MAASIARKLKSSRQSNVVKIASGPIRGTTYAYDDGKEASAFLGIPYAQPPIGELRFKKPLEAKHWTEVLECTQFGASCPHVPMDPNAELQCSEDCLFINVFAPELPNDAQAKLPVLFYIHGGAFVIDSANLVGDENICRYLCSQDIVVVTFNYRLGIFGFLTLANKSLPGNYGLFDMALALEWTHKNIGAFGGDTSRITVAGQSAGSGATDMLTLSPHTRGLFKNAICFAGTSHCPWFTFDQAAVRFATVEWAKYKGATLSGAPDAADAEIEAFYRKQPAERLALGALPDPSFKFAPNATLPMCPTFDGDFFPLPLAELRREAPPKSIINSITKREGLLFVFIGLADRNRSLTEVIARLICSFQSNVPYEAAEKQATLALGASTDRNNSAHVEHAVDVYGDIMFNYGAAEMSKERSTLGSKLYNSIFSHYRENTLGNAQMLLPFGDSTHCMELPYFFGRSILGGFEVTPADEPIIDRYLAYLTAFIKTGDPNNEKYAEKWTPQTHEQPANDYFEFGTNESGMRERFDRGRFDVWPKFYAEYPLKNIVKTQKASL